MILNSISNFFRSITISLSHSTPTTARPLVVPSDSSQYLSSASSIPKEVQHAVGQVRNQISQKLAHPEPKTLAQVAQLNQKRKGKGLPPIDLQKVTKHLEAIQENTCMSSKEKKTKVEALRKTLGLSKGEMKGLFTQRLGRIYKEAEKSLASFEKAKESQLKSELRQAESIHGKGSVQAQAVQNKIQALQAQLEPEKRRLSESNSFYRSLYPSFWSRLGGFFKKVGGGFLKALGGLGAALRFIPGIGPLASRVVGSVKYLFQGFRLDKFFGNVGKGVFDTVRNWKSFLPLIPGVGNIASLAVNGVESIVKATRAGGKPF